MDRSATMRAVKGRDTRPELAVRGLIRPISPGYRLHRSDVPGKPDIVYLGVKRAIFVHGCFWHGHHCKRGARIPKTNTAYWKAKISRNRFRDRLVRRRLRKLGWQTLVIWECQTKNAHKLLGRLKSFLSAQ
jgi:DNA mismatch endonuclease, patch repair protein